MKNGKGKATDPNALTEKQRILAIAAGMVGGHYNKESGVITMEGAGVRGVQVQYNEVGELVFHFDVNQTDKWKEYYANKVRAILEDKTAMVGRIIASKGRSV